MPIRATRRGQLARCRGAGHVIDDDFHCGGEDEIPGTAGVVVGRVATRRQRERMKTNMSAGVRLNGVRFRTCIRNRLGRELCQQLDLRSTPRVHER
jgi:hypothetical protein